MSITPSTHNPVSLALANREASEVLKAIIMLPDEEFRAITRKIPGEQIADCAMYVLQKCHMAGVQEVFTFGGLLEFFAAVTETQGHTELMRNMEEDLGVSRSQAYRCRAVFRCFGRTLLSESETLQLFRRESLKLLAEDRTPDSARAEALQLARKGERITIKVAKSLQEKHGMTLPAPAASTTAVVADKPGHWVFSGSTVRIKLVHNEPGELADVPAVIRDLEAAINELRQMQENIAAA